MELEHYFKAGSPCLHLPTTEYELAGLKIFEAFRSVIDLEEVTVGTWKVTEGLCLGSLRKGTGEFPVLKAQPPEKSDLLEVFSFIALSPEPVLVVFHNLRFWLSEPAAMQGLIDATLKAKKVGSHLVLLGPTLDVPPELKSLIVTIPFPLPSFEEIEKLFTRITNYYSRTLRLPDGKRWFKTTGKMVNGQKEEDLTWRAEQKAKIIATAARSACGMDLFSAETAISLSIAHSNTIDPKVIGAHKRQEVAKSEILEFIDRDEDLGNLGGFGDLKEWLSLREKAFSQKARDYGLSYPKGVLIVGPAGTGKSLAAKAIGTHLGIDTLRLDGSKMFSRYIGDTEQRFNMALRVAEVVAPVNIWLDEVEKIFAGHQSSGKLDSGVTSHVLQSLLTWRQETKSPVMIVATANGIEDLPPELLRKGRFDEIWTTALPVASERAEIFAIHLRKRGRDPEKFDVALLARKSKGYVGAEIESAIEDAMYTAFFQDREIETADILRSMRNTQCQSQRDPRAIERILEWTKQHARPVSSETDDESAKPNESSKIRRLKKGTDDDD